MDQELTALIQDAGELKKRHIDSAIEYYQSHARRPRILSRLFGYTAILLSVALPFLTKVNFPYREVVESVDALLVAALTSTVSFGQWDAQWRGFKQAQFELEALAATWDFQIMEARHLPDAEKAKKVIMAATRTLMERAKVAVTTETERHFEALAAPQLTKK